MVGITVFGVQYYFLTPYLVRNEGAYCPMIRGQPKAKWNQSGH